MPARDLCGDIYCNKCGWAIDGTCEGKIRMELANDRKCY